MYNRELYKKLNTYFLNKLGLRPYRRGWLKGNCPDCGREGKFGVSLQRDRTNCFVCGYDPNPLILVKDLEGLKDIKEVKELLSDYKGTEYFEPIKKELQEVSIILPEGYKNILIGDSKLANLARAYIKGRGFNLDLVASKGWGYCNEGKLFGYIILPYYMGGKLVYYNARRFVGGGPKYVNPTIEESGIGKSLIIYNADALDIYKEIYLVEGLFNAETLGSQGIATAGKMVSSTQLSIIKRSPVEVVTLVLDPDALKESIGIAMDLTFYKKVRLVYWEGNKDINDLGKKESLKIINSFDITDYNGLLKLKNKINAKGSVITY